MFLKTWVKPTIDRHYLVGIINIKDCTQKKPKPKKENLQFSGQGTLNMARLQPWFKMQVFTWETIVQTGDGLS
jgi:hypothetical protein